MKLDRAKLTNIEILLRRNRIWVLLQIKWFRLFIKHATQIIHSEIWFLNVKFLMFSNENSRRCRRKNKRTFERCDFRSRWCNFECRKKKTRTRWCENWFENYWKTEFLTFWCCKRNREFQRNKRNRWTSDCWFLCDFAYRFECENSKIRILNRFSSMMLTYMLVKSIIEVEYLIATSTSRWTFRWFWLMRNEWRLLDFTYEIDCIDRKIKILDELTNDFLNFCLFLSFLFSLMCMTSELLLYSMT